LLDLAELVTHVVVRGVAVQVVDAAAARGYCSEEAEEAEREERVVDFGT
jgi:hypothetical protein